MRKYIIQSEFVAEDKQLDTNERLNAIVFTNRGTNPVYINGEPLAENESLNNSGLEGEIDTTPYRVRFDTAGAGTSLLHVRRKVYI